MSKVSETREGPITTQTPHPTPRQECYVGSGNVLGSQLSNDAHDMGIVTTF